MVQMFDREVVREYLKRHSGFIFSWTEVLRSERISSEVVLTIEADKVPDKVVFNGENYTLVKA